jgi:hypothetical protein
MHEHEGCVEELEEYLAVIEKMLGRKLGDGRGDGVKSIRLTLDMVKTAHRPIIWYAVSENIMLLRLILLIVFFMKDRSFGGHVFDALPSLPRVQTLHLLEMVPNISSSTILEFLFPSRGNTTRYPPTLLVSPT